MKKTLTLLCLLLLSIALVGCKKNGEQTPNITDLTQTSDLPKDPVDPGDEEDDGPLILDEYGNFGGTTNRSKYGLGAPLNGQYDQPDSVYYMVNDYYNMKSTQDRTIFTGFKTYQQTMADSSGIASALMILNYLGEDVINEYNEVELVKRYELLNNKTVYKNGTTAVGLVNLFTNLGYTATAGSYTETGKTTNDKIANFIDWLEDHLNNGRFVMVRYQDVMEFGWHVIIGLDTMGTDFPRDDVLIMADPYDNWDHKQDGYVTQAAGRFYRWWLNVEESGVTTDAFDCVVVTPKTKIKIERVNEEREIVQTIPERHLILNPDGSFGGTRDEALYGYIDGKDGEFDQLTSIYHAFVDYYNMENTDSRYILSNYMAYQQTMASSCGISSVLSVLNYYGFDVSIYDEVFLVNKYEELNDTVIKNKGVGSTGLRKLVESLGFVADAKSFSRDKFVDSNSMIFSTYEEFLTWVQSNLSKGTPMPISWRPHSGHWEVIIGIDTMGTDYIYDDVIILADSHDTWDHYTDGYNTIPAVMFYRQWYNGSYTYNQQYCVFDNIEK